MMAAAVKRGAQADMGEVSSADGCKEVVQGILRAVQRCVEKLQQTNDAVSFAINWDKIECLSGVEPAFLCSVLKQHVSDLQPLLDQLTSLSNGKEKSVRLERAGVSRCTADVGESKEKINAGNITSKLTPNNVLVDSNSLTDPTVVQIQARKSEIDRRILAFIERKQAEINENNVREFCNVIDCNQENSCARTDAVFTPFPGFKSHIKGGPVPKDIYQRIKKLEDRILELEGISPEYFQSMDASNKRRKVQASQNYSLVELDQKINALRQTLLQKSKRGISIDDEVLS